MKEAILHIGSNKGDRYKHLITTRELIEIHINPILKESKIYETDAWGVNEQPAFLNQVLVINTFLKPLQLLKRLQKIEAIIGKEKDFHWGPRNIDIDIIFYGSDIIKEENLTIPHPLMQERNFVLYPLNEVCRDKIHPILNCTVGEILKKCQDTLAVKNLEKIEQ
jgi:2-amino-4-hydroxy-6-hydroxymethyldihydropteridine diphosphokinase